MNFVNAQAKLTDLNFKANSVYTQVIDANVKPMVMSLYKKVLSEQGYGKSIWFGDMDIYLEVLPFETHDVLLIKNVVTCFDRNVLSFVIADKDHVQAAHCFEPQEDFDAFELEYKLHEWFWLEEACFYKKEETLCEPYYNGHSCYQMKNSNGFIEDNILFCIDMVERSYRNVVEENNFKVSV